MYKSCVSAFVLLFCRETSCPAPWLPPLVKLAQRASFRFRVQSYTHFIYVPTFFRSLEKHSTNNCQSIDFILYRLPKKRISRKIFYKVRLKLHEAYLFLFSDNCSSKNSQASDTHNGHSRSTTCVSLPFSSLH